MSEEKRKLSERAVRSYILESPERAVLFIACLCYYGMSLLKVSLYEVAVIYRSVVMYSC